MENVDVPCDHYGGLMVMRVVDGKISPNFKFAEKSINSDRCYQFYDRLSF